MSTNISLGWTKEGTAGYALDANDLMFLPRGVRQTSTYVCVVWNAVDGLFIATGGSVTATFATSGGAFNKGYANLSCNNLSLLGSNIPSSNTTIRGWVQPNPTNNSSGIFFGMRDVIPTESQQKHIGLILTGTTLQLVKYYYYGAHTVLLSMTMTADFHYISLIRNGTVITVFIDGVLSGTYTSALLTGTGGYAQILVDYGGGFRFTEIQVSKVARDGSFVPGNLLGF